MNIMNKYRNWTEEDLSFLLNNYGKISTDKISKKINKSIGSIYYVLKKEEIELEKRWWSKEEIKELKSIYSAHSNQELEKIFNRSEDAIQLKAASLKLKKDLWWSEEELLVLRDMVFERLSYTKMGKALNRTRSAVHNKLIEQGLTDECRRWTTEELEKIKSLALSGEYTYLDIANELDATPGQICGVCKYKNWRDRIKRTMSYGNDKMFKLIKQIFPNQIAKQEYHIGERLRLDAYLPQLKLGFEYDGIQHFRYTPQWHRTKQEFEKAKERDKRKDELCFQQNISLVRIKYNEDLSKDLLEEKIQIVLSTPAIEIKSMKPKSAIQSRGFNKDRPKQKIQSRGFQKPKDGYKWPKRKIINL